MKSQHDLILRISVYRVTAGPMAWNNQHALASWFE